MLRYYRGIRLPAGGVSSISVINQIVIFYQQYICAFRHNKKQ